jgi:hypothetical protein
MFLELSADEIMDLINDPEKLKAKIVEARKLLRNSA